jgi:hypothetical protein
MEQKKGVLVSKPLRIFAFVSLAWIAVVTSSIGQAAAPTPFDPKPWLEDLDQTREAIATKYANLEWVVLEREIDLAALFTVTMPITEVSARRY